MSSHTESAIARRLLAEIGNFETERRDGQRIRALEQSRVYCTDSKLHYDVTIKDISSRGLSIGAAQPFDLGTTLVVEWCSGYLPATVRHCRSTAGEWVIGLEAEPLPGSRNLLAEMKASAHQRNRLLLTNARPSA